MKTEYKNRQIVKKYKQYLEGAENYKPGTINLHLAALDTYQEFTGHADFRDFDRNQALEFKDAYLKYDSRGKCISPSTVIQYFSALSGFFKWLSSEAGYKRIPLNDIGYFNLGEKIKNEVGSEPKYEYPSRDHTRQLVESIKLETELDYRDAAAISLDFVTGIRIASLKGLPLGLIDLRTRIIRQSPKYDMEVKGSKNIVSLISKMDPIFDERIWEWIEILRKKGFGDDSPFLPQSKLYKPDGSLSFAKSFEVIDQFFSSITPLGEIFTSRAKAAGLPIFTPHDFRRGYLMETLDHIHNAKQLSAVSLMMGHEFVQTTLMTYGRLSPIMMLEVARTIDMNDNGGTRLNWAG